MKEIMKLRIFISALFLTAVSISYGQAVPAGVATVSTGPNLSALDGILHYALSASEIVQWGFDGPGDTTSSTALSGDVAYTSKSAVKPFSMIFAGGVIIPSGQNEGGVTTYQNISASQGYITEHWGFNIADSFGFLPQSPTTGISGIPGVGDLGATPIPGPGTGIAGGLLSTSGDRLFNTLSGGVERSINHVTSITGSAAWSVLRFENSDTVQGLDSTQFMGSVAISRKLDPRSSVSVSGVYSAFDYSGSESVNAEPSIDSRGINLGYQRVLSRSLSLSASVGPQWVSSSDSELVPSSLSVAASVGVSYIKGHTSATLGYSRGVNAGSGVLPGAESDTISGGIGHPYGRNWVVSLTGSYQHSNGLAEVPVTSTEVAFEKETFNTVYGGLQVSRRFSTHFSGYASYTAESQTNNFLLAGQNAFTGTSQTFGVGVSFTPRSTRLGQF
jgi:hypothetical protein